MKLHHVGIILALLIIGGMTWAQDETVSPELCTDDELEEIYELVEEDNEINERLEDILNDIGEVGAGNPLDPILFDLYELRDDYLLDVVFSLPDCDQAIEFDRYFTRYLFAITTNVGAFTLGMHSDDADYFDYGSSLNDDAGTYYTQYDLSWFIIELLTGNYEGD